MGLMAFKSSFVKSIRGAIPNSKIAKAYLGKVKDQFKGSSKVDTTSLIKRLVGKQYNVTGSLRDHIMKQATWPPNLNFWR